MMNKLKKKRRGRNGEKVESVIVDVV